MNEKFTYLAGANSLYIQDMLDRYLEDPDDVESSWRSFFDGIELGYSNPFELDDTIHLPNATASNKHRPSGEALYAEAQVAELIQAYRELGRLLCDLDPLNEPPESHPLLELSNFQLGEEHLDTIFTAGNLIGLGPAPLRQIVATLQEIYCSTIGVEYTHIEDPTIRDWLEKKMEHGRNKEQISPRSQRYIHERLADAELFENFLHTRFVAQKRFSLEGSESLIPLLDRIINVAADSGCNNVVMGMSHRGRLNVLHNIYGKKATHIFTEFEQNYQVESVLTEGDVKYHMGFSADIETRNGKPVHLSLAHNPSHLEFVAPVVEGVCRAKQRQQGDSDATQVLPIVIHGDAAFAGQGIVYETLNLSQLPGYWTGGTIHIVVNNQIGFTTDPACSRSTTYATDVAKMLEVPIFHVNGDDPEACWYLAKLCTEFRQKFKKDIFIDLICYRKYGHNEGDEPAFTQPMMYKKIKAHPSTRALYEQQLVSSQVFSQSDAKLYADDKIKQFTEALNKTRTEKPKPFNSTFKSVWSGYKEPTEENVSKDVATAVSVDILRDLSQQLTTFPKEFNVHPKLQKFYKARAKAITDGNNIDWGNAETMAYASLIEEGHVVRISGQDVERGTFSHRHSVLSDCENGERYTPLNNISKTQGEYIAVNSSLSEAAVMCFEYGWSLADPTAIVIWEGQFGDFANGAQVIIDQFISSSHSKWNRSTGLVLFLPHGYEGQGPEHSSARLERFLQLCARTNMSICNFTTPVNLFHALRRQVKASYRLPMVIMTPKSLLRHARCTSKLFEFTSGSYQPVIDDVEFSSAVRVKSVKRVILCSGKIFYDLVAQRESQGLNHVAIIRIEQLYPWPEQWVQQYIKQYVHTEEVMWVQEEPANMGAWTYIFSLWAGGLDDFGERVNFPKIKYVGRSPGAAPAVGSLKRHKRRQQEIVDKALSPMGTQTDQGQQD